MIMPLPAVPIVTIEIDGVAIPQIPSLTYIGQTITLPAGSGRVIVLKRTSVRRMTVDTGALVVAKPSAIGPDSVFVFLRRE